MSFLTIFVLELKFNIYTNFWNELENKTQNQHFVRGETLRKSPRASDNLNMIVSIAGT